MVSVYAAPADLAAALGTGQTVGLDERLALACIVGSQWVDHRVGNVVDTSAQIPPYDPVVVACPPAWRAAAIAAAVRFYRSPDVPFGVMQVGGDYGMSVKTSIPEAELMLLGHRAPGGIA